MGVLRKSSQNSLQTVSSVCWSRESLASSSRHQSAITSQRSYANYTGWKFHGG